jgi:hypothetical protein
MQDDLSPYRLTDDALSQPVDLNTAQPIQNFAVGGIANPGQTVFLRPSDKAYLNQRQQMLEDYERQRQAYNDALTKYQTEVYNPYQAQVKAYNDAAAKYNEEVYKPYESQYAAYEKAVNDWNAGSRETDYAGPSEPVVASKFEMTAPKTPEAFSMTAPTLPFEEKEVQEYQQAAAQRAKTDAANRALAIDVVSNPDRFNFGSMSVANRFMAHGGEVEHFAEGGEVVQESEEPDSEGYYQQLLAQYAGYGAPQQTPVQSFAKGGSAGLDAMNALIDASEPQTEDEAAADYLSQSQQMLEDLGPRTSPRQAVGMSRVMVPSGGGAAAPKEMELAAGPLATGQDFAIKEPKSKGKGGKSAKEQLQALAKQYKLKLRAAENESRGLMRSTLGAPTLEQPTLTSETLGVRRFEKGGEVTSSPEEQPVTEESSASRALKSIVSPVMEGLRGYAGLEPGASGSDAYRTGQALGNMPGVGVPGALAGIFIGKGAKGWNAASNALAQKMTKQGAAPEEVWKATGNFKAPDGMWRQEISDAGATIREAVLQGPAERVLSHPELFANYPELGKIMTSKDPYSTRSVLMGGSGPGASIRLGTAGGKNENAKGMLHELQHGIQFREGFGQGGSKNMAFNDPQAFEILKEVRGRMAQPTSIEKFAKVAWQSDEVTPEIAKKYQEYLDYHKKSLKTMDRAAQEGAADLYYKRLLGEAEARAVEDRKMWTPDQRLQVIPSQSYRMNAGRDIIPLDKLIVKRAEGSPKEGEVSDAELEAARRPAFVTPSSGKGRRRGPISDALNTGSAYVAAAKGASELPYDLVGAPVDIATMALRPLGYNVDKPVMGSDWIKEKMTRAGVRQAPPEDPTAKGFYTAGETLANLVNPAGVVRGGVNAARRAGQAASDVAKDFQQYNRQLAVPGASYAAPLRREAEPLYTPRPTADAPFVGRIDQFAASLPGPVRKDQILGQLKGKFRDHEIGRAQEALADLDATAKITPSDLLNRLKQSSDPARYRTQVVEPDSTSFYRTMDNPYQDRPMGVIHLIQDQLPEVAAQSGRLKTLFDNVRSKTYGTLGQSEEEVNNLSRSIQELTKSTPPNLVSQITTAFTPYVQAQKARRDFADLEDTLLYPTLSSRYKGLVRERMNDPEQQALGSLQITRKAAEDTITEAAEKLATQYNVPQIRQYVPGLVEGNKEAQKQVEDITEALRGDLRSQIQREGQSLRAALDRTISAGVKPYRGQHSGLKNDPDPIAFSRFSEHETVIPGIGPTKGIYIHELQSDRLDDIRKLGPLGGNVSTDFHEKYLPLMDKKDALMKEFVQLRSTGQSGDRYNEVLKQIGKVDSDIAKINKRIQEGTYSLKESFPGMENSPQVIQQLMAKNAIAAAINRGVNFVAFPGAESAQAQLYEKLPRNLKEVVKDLGPGFEYSSVTLRKPDGTEIMHPAVIWGTESAARVKKEGVPFKKGGLVDKNTAFIKAHA